MADPRLEDGSADVPAPPSTRAPDAIVRQLLTSLTSACLALEELDSEVVRGLRDNVRYIARMNRLMVPLLSFPTEGLEEQMGELVVVPESSRSSAQAEDFQLVVSASSAGDSLLKRSAEGTSTVGPSSLPSALTPILSNNPSSAAVLTQLQPKEVIKRRNAGDPVPEMTLSEQYDLVAALLRKKEIKSGEAWYLVDKRWWDSWVKASSNSNDPRLKAAGIRYTMDAINNSNLVDPSTGNLRQGLVSHTNKFQEVRGPAQGNIFVAVPREVWENCLVPWYGKPTHTITRPLKSIGFQGYAVDLTPGGLTQIDDKNWAVGSRWALINRRITFSEPLHGTVYVVSSKWWSMWRLQEGGMPGLDQAGAIDNSDLLDG